MRERRGDVAETEHTVRENGVVMMVRRAGPLDAPEIAGLFRQEYQASSHPFQALADVAVFLEDAKNHHFVAVTDGRIVASMAMSYCAWNDAYELGRAITHHDYRRRGLAALLMQPVVDRVCDALAGQVFFGFPRARCMVELCARLIPSMIVAGHDGGRHVANGARETHLIVYAIPRHAHFRHVTPTVSCLSASQTVRNRYYAPLGIRDAPGPYPDTAFVGPPCRDAMEIEGLLVDRGCASPSRALEIIGEIRHRDRPQHLSRALTQLERVSPDLRHLTATVLADKWPVINELCTVGYRVVAYLPAWHRVGQSRYDCVQLVKQLFTAPPIASGFDDLVTQLDVELQSATVSPSTSQLNDCEPSVKN